MITYPQKPSKIVKQIGLFRSLKINYSAYRLLITSARFFNDYITMAQIFAVHVLLGNLPCYHIIIVNNAIIRKIGCTKHANACTVRIIRPPFS